MQLIPLIVAVFAALVTACDSGAPQKQNACLSKDSRTLSCHNTTVVNTCCSEYPGGLVLQTQFWGTGLGAGPKDSWTIHGLWPDFCDGIYLIGGERRSRHG